MDIQTNALTAADEWDSDYPGMGFGEGLGLAEKLFFGGILTFVVIIALFTVYAIVKNYVHLKRNGVDPITAQSQMYTRAMDSTMLAPHASLEDRLAELDRLHAASKITDAEHAAARSRLLSQF